MGCGRRLGFEDGTVLEPGCGSGNFIGFAPPSARMLGIELDPVTAGIAAALYPDAEIRNESFADTRVPDGGFDLVIGNVPFSNAILTDDRHNRARYSMHNHFILKSLAAARPGGLVAVLTSRYTLDAIADSARREMTGRADLITAVRLPSGAHRRAAGTEAVTDLLVLRRREDGRPRAGAGWEQSVPVEFEGGTARVSEFFIAHPENVLGDLAVGGGQYSGEELTVRPRDLARVPDDLAARLAVAVADAHENGLAMSPRAQGQSTADVRAGDGQVSLRVPSRDAGRFEGTITAHADGTFTVLRDGQAEPWPCPDSQTAELRALLRLRDTVGQLLDAERASAGDTPQLADLRTRLNREYDAYTAVHGPLNRMSWRRTGRHDEAGNETWARQAPAQGKFRSDPYAAIVYALEDFDPETGTASKAPIFTQRVIADRQPAETAETPADAIAICMDADGQVRLERAASLLGSSSPEEARATLGELVYDEPGTGRLVPAAEYLSGKVRGKLAEAEKAAQTDPRFAVNVAALRGVLPADLGPGDIDARLGASWIPPEYVQQGLREILEDRTLTAVKGHGTTWQVKGNAHSLEARDVYGTADKDAISLAQCLLEQRPIKVSYSMDDLTPAEKERLSAARGRNDMAAFMRARAAAATITARAKADELSDRFSEWLWEDSKRTTELVRAYNEKFNSLVLRSYDGARPRLPGLAEWFKPFPHQYAAVARIVSEPAALLAHEVGAGKTAEMAMGCMELRRLGLASKPSIIVPNHMLEQFQREFLQLYPQARVLACGTRDLQKNRRHAFVARIATGDWDAVIMSRSVFERIPMSAAEQERYIGGKLDAYDTWLEQAAAESEDTRMVKRMEKQRLSFEGRLKRKLSRSRDAGISWEQTGIDYLMVDEAHGYKNLDTRSNSPALDIDGSGRASDLEMKLDYLRRENGQRIVTFATATPIANSMTEAYVMLKYLRPDLLTDAGIEDFDGWAGSFATTISDVEVAPEGGLRVKERVARFRNLPELLLMWRVVADVKTAEDLKLPVPSLASGKPEVVTVPPSEELRSFMLTLAGRASDVRLGRVEPKEDNMLKISSDGRAAALDLRLVGLSPPGEDGKLGIAATRIAQIYHDTRDNAYRDRDGNPESATGSLQIVFCELGTPTGSSKFGVYEYLKAQLAERGVPADQVRWMHEARNDREKADLFAAARSGKVSVLIGTTELMGVGTNVQKRAVALHHLDCPWRPADVAQREGRILRQGNQNPQVQIIRYVTEGSFDAYMWQTVLRKSKFIAQVMHGTLDSREIEDIGGSESLSYSEVTALATGDMRILAKAKADAEVQRLSKLETSWKRTKRHLKIRIADGQRDLPRLRDKAAKLDAAIGRRVTMKGDAFRCELGGKPISKRADAADELQSALEALYQRAKFRGREHHESDGTPLGTFGGFGLEAVAGIDSFGVYADLRFPAIPGGSIRVRTADPKLGVITKLENKLSSLDETFARTCQQITDTEAEIERATGSLDAPFAKAADLARARYESDRLAAELGGQQVLPQEPEAHETPAADAETQRDPDEDDDIAASGQDEAWAAADAEADPDEDVLEDTGVTNDIDDDEWDNEPTQPAGPDSSSTEADHDPGDEEPKPIADGEPAPDEPAAVPEVPPPVTAIRIEHDHQGTRVFGTDKSQTSVRKALKAEGFKWSRQGYWYLNRSWQEHTRADRVRRLATALGSLNVGYEVTRQNVTAAGSASSEPETAPPAAAEPADPARPEAPAEAAVAPIEPAEHADREDVSSAPVEPQPAVPAPKPAQDFEQESLFGLQDPADENTISSSQSDRIEPTPSPNTQKQPEVAGHEQQQETGQAASSTATPEAPAETASEQTDRASTADADNEHDAMPQAQEAAQPANTPAQATAILGLEAIPVNPSPLAGRGQAESGARVIESDYLGWMSTRDQPDDSRLPKEHPRVRQLITRWRAVHAKGIADGPGPSAARYHALAHAALSLAIATDSTHHPRELATLNQLATDARKFSVRLRATAEHVFATGDKASTYRGGHGGRNQAERGSRIVEQDYRTWSRTGAPPEAARDLALWEQARRAELAWHAIRRSGLHDGPGPSAARYRELADAAQAIADGFTPNLSSAALLPLLQLADHARKHSIRLEATERARTSPETARTSENTQCNGRPAEEDAYGTLPSGLSAVTRNAYAAQHRSPGQDSAPAAAGPPPSRNPAFARHSAQHERD